MVVVVVEGGVVYNYVLWVCVPLSSVLSSLSSSVLLFFLSVPV